jgi:hypothetical protein
MAKAYQEQLLQDSKLDRVKIDTAPQKRKPALEFIRTVLRVLKRSAIASQQRREPADLDANTI